MWSGAWSKWTENRAGGAAERGRGRGLERKRARGQGSRRRAGLGAWLGRSSKMGWGCDPRRGGGVAWESGGRGAGGIQRRAFSGSRPARRQPRGSAREQRLLREPGVLRAPWDLDRPSVAGTSWILWLWRLRRVGAARGEAALLRASVRGARGAWGQASGAVSRETAERN